MVRTLVSHCTIRPLVRKLKKKKNPTSHVAWPRGKESITSVGMQMEKLDPYTVLVVNCATFGKQSSTQKLKDRVTTCPGNSISRYIPTQK